MKTAGNPKSSEARLPPKGASSRPGKADGGVARHVFWLASLMFFLSGATGLAYQVIWFKRFGHVWGSSSLAFASVGGSFLFGLGVGAYLFGRIADRLERPLRWYGFCEMAIGIAALVIPLEIQWLIAWSAGFYAFLPNEPLARYLLQFAVTLLVVGPPCVLMGGTLPLLIRALTAREGALDQATGWLYAINTFGAAAGCYLAGFVLLPMIGLLQTNYLAAALNVTIGLGALALSPRARARKKQHVAPPPAEPATGWTMSMFGLYSAVALSGLGALMLEMTWSRQLALVLGGSTYSYSATLFVVLVGIAAGSLLFHLVLRPIALNPWLPVITISALAASCLASRMLLPWLSNRVGAWYDVRASLVGNAGVCLAAGALVELIPALAMGILFPLFVDLTRARASRVGRTVGDVYAWNTFGSIVGASLTSIVLFPRIGTAGSLALATALYVVTLVLVLPMRSIADYLRAAVGAALGAGAIAGILMPQNPLLTNMGTYLYGYRPNALQGVELEYFKEGASTNVVVSKLPDGSPCLRVNGKIDASRGSDMTMQLGMAYLPRILRPKARDVLVIGFGSGTATGASLLFKDAHVTCCEIEPAVFEAASYFSGFNHRPQEKTRQFLEKRNANLPLAERLSADEMAREARLTMVFGDGRTQLQQDDKKYDIIVSEPSNPWLAGVSNLFTEEFFTSAKAHLKPGGVLGQWIQTYQFTFADYLMIVRTMKEVFPYYGLIVFSSADTLLLASDVPLMPSASDLADLAELQQFLNETPEIRDDLLEWFGTTDVRVLLLSNFSVGPKLLDKWLAAGPRDRLNTDLNMRLEFEAPRHLFQKLERNTDAQSRLVGILDTEWMAQLGSVLNVAPESAEYQLAVGTALEIRQTFVAALAPLRKARELNPKLTDANKVVGNCFAQLAKLYREHEKTSEAIDTLKEWVAFQPDNAAAHFALYDACMSAGEKDAAAKALSPLIRVESESVQRNVALVIHLKTLKREEDAAWHARKALELAPTLAADPKNLAWVNNCAWILATHPDPAQRDGKEAVRWAKQLCEGDHYKQWTVIDTLAAAYAESGEFDEAIKLVELMRKRAAEIALEGTEESREQRQADSAKALGIAESRLKLYSAHKPYHEDPQTGESVP